MELDLTDREIFLLEKTCLEEIKYYERCVVADPTLKGQEAIKAGNYFLEQDKNKKIRDVMAKAVIVNIQEYRHIADKLENKNRDFDRKQLEKLRMMLEELFPLFERHLLVKTQVDGSVTYKHVHGVLLMAFEAAREAVLDNYKLILEKVNNALGKEK